MHGQLKIPDGKVVAVDTETTGLDPYQGDRIFAVSLCNADGETGYCEWAVDPKTRKVKPNPEDLKTLRRFLANPLRGKVFHNAPFDIGMFEHGLGLKVRGQVHDTLLAMHSCSTAEPSYGLKQLAEKYLEEPRTDVDELAVATKAARRSAKQRGWQIGKHVAQDYWLNRALDPTSRVCERYAVADVISTMRLWLELREQLDHQDLWETYRHAIAVQRLLQRIEGRGVGIDSEVNQQELQKHQELAATYLRKLKQIARNPDFNPGSGPQVARLLFDQLGLPVLEYTKKGNPSTGQEALVQYSDEPAARALIEYRVHRKAETSYFEAFKQKAVADPLVPGGFCIHPHFHQAGRRTGRLSCSKPNLQGIAGAESSRSESPFSARTPFGPRPGYLWYSVDYSQLEARIAAAVFREPVLIKAFACGRDLHTETANRAWGGADNSRAIKAAVETLGDVSEEVAEDWLIKFAYDIVAAEASLGTKHWRGRGKTIFFSRIMGGGVRQIMKKLKCNADEAREFLRAFDDAVPGIVASLRRCERQAKRDRLVTTMYGRRLDMLPTEYWKAGPYIVQGTAADLMKRRMLAVDEFFQSKSLDAHIVLSIHDELIFEIRQDIITDQLLRSIRRIMEDDEGRIGVDLPVELHLIRKTWAEKEKIELPRLRHRALVRRRAPR